MPKLDLLKLGSKTTPSSIISAVAARFNNRGPTKLFIPTDDDKSFVLQVNNHPVTSAWFSSNHNLKMVFPKKRALRELLEREQPGTEFLNQEGANNMYKAVNSLWAHSSFAKDSTKGASDTANSFSEVMFARYLAEEEGFGSALRVGKYQLSCDIVVSKDARVYAVDAYKPRFESSLATIESGVNGKFDELNGKLKQLSDELNKNPEKNDVNLLNSLRGAKATGTRDDDIFTTALKAFENSEIIPIVGVDTSLQSESQSEDVKELVFNKFGIDFAYSTGSFAKPELYKHSDLLQFIEKVHMEAYLLML